MLIGCGAQDRALCAFPIIMKVFRRAPIKAASMRLDSLSHWFGMWSLSCHSDKLSGSREITIVGSTPRRIFAQRVCELVPTGRDP
jgi:hypothetical protein